jgi:hypothetical protein
MKTICKALFISAFVLMSCGGDDEGSPSTGGGGGDDFLSDANASADYSLTFETIFTEDMFPTDYPANASFGPIVAITHAPDLSVYQLGQLASDGLKAYAEDGDVNALATFLSAEAGPDNEGSFSITTAPAVGPSTTSTIDVTVTPTRTRITFLAKLNPSPDWFVGFSSFDIVDGTNLVDEETFTLQPLDAGTAGGDTYEAPAEVENANVATYQGSPFGAGPFASNIAVITVSRDN